MTVVGTIQVVEILDENNAPWANHDARERLMRTAIVAEHNGFWARLYHDHPFQIIAPNRASFYGCVYTVRIELVLISLDLIERLATYEKALRVQAQDAFAFEMKPVPWVFRRQISFERAWAMPLPDDLRRTVFEFESE